MGNPLKTITYTYGDSSWGDLLTAYNGKAITYDGIGNPLTYNGWSFTWEHGRELVSMSKSGTTWTYTYDANGMRTSRSNGTTTYTYIYNGNQLVQMSDSTNTLYFTYDINGRPLTVTVNGTLYYYTTNLQGDVTSIWNPTDNYICEYYYDAWGNTVKTSTYVDCVVARLNPLRYRGYVYDQETSLYYLQSRYYTPEWGRFLNADGYIGIGGFVGNNMFAFCLNNPVNGFDPSGTAAHTLDGKLIGLNSLSGIVDNGGSGGIPGCGGESGRQQSLEVIQKGIDYFYNTDESVVLNAKYLAFYKGIPVIKLSFLGSNAFSFGVIFMGNDVGSRDDAINTVRHEYGHTVHFKQIGVLNYTAFVAIPSMVGYWANIPTEKYYSQPYEYIADVLGGVNRTYLGDPYPYSISPTAAAAYWVFTMIMP